VTLVAYGARLRPQRQDQLTPWSGHEVVQGIQRTSDSLAVVAVLIATSAFAAGFNVPGGYSDATGQAHLDREEEVRLRHLLVPGHVRRGDVRGRRDPARLREDVALRRRLV